MKDTAMQELPYPLGSDRAALAAQLRLLAEKGDAKFPGQTGVDGDYGAFFELGSAPAVVMAGKSGAAGVPPNTETALVFDGTGTVGSYSNMAPAPLGDLWLEAQDRPAWWWIGINLAMGSGAALNTQFLLRAYVQDTDPVTGAVSTQVLTQPYYSPSAGGENILLEGVVRSGGGRIRGTIQHAHGAALAPTVETVAWAIRVAMGV